MGILILDSDNKDCKSYDSIVVFLIFFKILLVADMSLIGYETLAKKVPLSLRENEK